MFAIATLPLFGAACADDPPNAPSLAPTVYMAKGGRARATATADWSAIARELVRTRQSNAFQAIRNYATVNLAQYNAAVAADDAKHGGPRLSQRAAVAAASVVVLSYAYPADAAALEAKLQQQLATPGWVEEGTKQLDEAVALGREIGAQVVEHAKTDRMFDPWLGTVPTGPGIWFSSATPPAAPGGPGFGAARTFFLTSPAQYRPGPPPAFNSPAFLAALGEVRDIAKTRTFVQDSIAKFWALPTGTVTPSGYWNEEGAELAATHGFTELRTARLMAVSSMAGFDALLACHDAKYTYWLLRPTQADPTISLAIGLPNFPSYPSNHACISAAQAAVIGDYIPGERARLHDRANEAAFSRVLGAIHYRFDGEVGLALGRRVASEALRVSALERDGFAPR